MAQIKFSPLVDDARGSVGDTTFSKWKGRSYIRTRVTPSNPQTTAQTNVRDAMRETVGLWQSLSTALKGFFGDGSAGLRISGYNDCVKRNRTPIQDNSGLYGPRHDPTLPAGSPMLPESPGLSAGSGTGEVEVSFTDPGGGADDYLGVIAYGTEQKIVVEETLDAVLLSGSSPYTITGFNGGETALVAVLGYNVSTPAAQHAYAGSATAAS